MKAIDTSVLVRWIARDDPVQTPISDAILVQPFFVPITVLIETIRVLGGRTYRYTPAMIRAAIDTLLELDTGRSLERTGSAGRSTGMRLAPSYPT